MAGTAQHKTREEIELERALAARQREADRVRAARKAKRARDARERRAAARKARERQKADDHELCERLRAAGDVRLKDGTTMSLWQYVLSLLPQEQHQPAAGGPPPPDGDGRA